MRKKKIVRVPLAGNAYLTEKHTGSGKVTASGIADWSSPDAVFAVYVKLKNPADFDVSLKVRAQAADSVLSLSAFGVTREAAVHAGDREISFGSFTSPSAGYVKFELRGVEKSGRTFASPSELILSGITEDEIDAYVSPKDRDNYYWTRRGPSVHCSYSLNGRDDVEWFYNEVTVPEGYDKIGTYAMAIGFQGGYFGIQVNSNSERRILFSIWSPYVTDNPEEIPEDDRIICLGHHENTHVGTFGGEGSGGQSYMKYKWKAGETYRFLMHVKPTENNRSEFSAYFFFPESGKFEPVASFSRPKTQTYLKGVHSFLENFDDRGGYLTRMAYYGNQWGCTSGGEWFAPEKVRFTGDNTARSGWRKDYTGGVTEDGRFYLRHCGFFDETGEIGRVFDMPKSTEAAHPAVDDIMRG